MLSSLYTRNGRADLLDLGTVAVADVEFGVGAFGPIPRRPTHLSVADTPEEALRALEGNPEPHPRRGIPLYRFMEIRKPGGQFRAYLVDGDIEWRGPPAKDEHEAIDLLRREMKWPFFLPHRSRDYFGDFIPLRSFQHHYRLGGGWHLDPALLRFPFFVGESGKVAKATSAEWTLAHLRRQIRGEMPKDIQVTATWDPRIGPDTIRVPYSHYPVINLPDTVYSLRG